MQVVVIGNPFDMPQSALEKAVIDAMQSSAFGVPFDCDPSRRAITATIFSPKLFAG